MVLLLPFTAFAKDIDIRSAFVESNAGVLLLSAQVDFELPAGAQQAIRDGVELTLTFDIEVSRGRRYWTDEGVAQLEQRYELLYHAVSGRYLVRNLNSGEQGSYPTLDAALEPLHRIERLPILDEALVRSKGRYEISLRASLDVHTMPDALRFIVFWADDWRQASEWYTWPLRL
ncbi:MAG: DUF4390 domain-containing protein [Steroidobacteraceae bacterium]